MLRGAIFDMDGVLVDNMKVHTVAFIRFASRYGVDMDADTLLTVAGMGNEEIFARLFPAEVVERVGAVALADEKEALYREIYAATITPAGGLVELLDELRGHGVKTAVGTSAITANLDFVLDRLDIRRRFDALVNADMVTRTKPDPEIYLRALSELGIRADEALVFEDAPIGIRAAAAAGIKVVALATSHERAAVENLPGVVLTIDDFTEVDFARLGELL
jgi:beta-phosphoglucomutase family hydrolase